MQQLAALIIALSITSASSKPKLIYVGDPMCSWCYGISEELMSTLSQLDGQVETELVVGGLRAGGGEEWTAEFRSFLRHHWEDVAKASGQPFGFELLEQPQFDYDTEPSCRAVVAVHSMDSSKQFAFFKEVQKKFYLHGQDPKLVAFYESVCKDMDLDFQVFAQKFKSLEMSSATKDHFARSRELGVNSFPTILLEVDGQRHVIARGYATADQMVAAISKLID